MLYRSPSEWGKRISFSRVIVLPFATPVIVVAHSPTPSSDRSTASEKGERVTSTPCVLHDDGHTILLQRIQFPF